MNAYFVSETTVVDLKPAMSLISFDVQPNTCFLFDICNTNRIFFSKGLSIYICNTALFMCILTVQYSCMKITCNFQK
jgi:hypothetical protein